MAEKTGPSGALEVTSALDPALLDRPQRAVDSAARELLGMGQKIEQMLIAVDPLYDQWNVTTANMIADQDKAIKQTHLDIKLYLARLGQKGMDEDLSRRSLELASISSSLDSASDAITRPCWTSLSVCIGKSSSFRSRAGMKSGISPTGFKAMRNWR
jgi:phosphate:Na+ symporter